MFREKKGMPAYQCRSLVVGFLSILGISTSLAGTSEDWPQWRGPERTGHLAVGQQLPAKLSGEPRIRWRVKCGEGFASPVVAGGNVVLADNQGGRETVRSFSVVDGREVWRADVDETFLDTQGPRGPRCSPVIDEDRVYAQSCRGELKCLDLASGRLLWRTHYGTNYGAIFVGEKGATPGAGRHGNNGAPVVAGDWLYASVGGTNGAGMVCFQKRTGAERWRSGNEVAAYAAPVVATIAGRSQVVNFMAEALTAFDAATGRQLWRFPVKTAFARHVTTPIIQGDLIVVSSHQYGLFAVRVEVDAAAPAGFRVAEVWKSREAAMNFSCPIAVDGWIYGMGPAKDVVCVELATGQVRWRQEGWITSSADKAHAGFLTDGKAILMLGDDGMLFHFAADGAAARELGRMQLCRANWCNPALAGNRLYVRDNLKGPGELLAVDLSP